MFLDFQKLVMEFYNWKRRANELPSELLHPAQGRLKKMSARMCRQNLQKKDEKAIRDFCGDWDLSKSCLQLITQCDPDKFKPISNYLKDLSEKPGEKQIELLAWLLDFPLRPFVVEKDYSGIRIEELVGESTAVDPGEKQLVPTASALTVNEGGGVIPEIPKIPIGEMGSVKTEGAVAAEASKNVSKVGADTVPQWKYRKLFLVALLLLSGGGAGLFWWWDNRDPGGCMYWAEDSYQPIPCNQKMPNKRIVALDTALVKNFRKITQPDTITYRAKGRVWYSKINNKVEFFTSDGVHPVVFGRSLKPITDYMIDKYIKQGMTSNP